MVGESRVGGARIVPTASGVYGVSKYGQARYGAENGLYSVLKDALDSINGRKPNNVHDALIAETSVKEGHILVTDDAHLAAVTKAYGGECLSVDELLLRCTLWAST